MRLTSWDWFIAVAYVVIALIVGVAATKRIKSAADFLVAGRQIRFHLGVASLVATELGLVTVMYFAEQGFRFGFAAFIIGVIWSAAYLLVGSTGFVVERVRRLEIMTITEYFELRYSRGVRVLGALLLVVAGVLSLGVFLKLSTVFMVQFLNIPETYIHLTMTLLVAVVVVYTVLGGMVSVVVTDFIQFLLLAAGMVITTFFVFDQHGFLGMFDQAERLYGREAFSPISHPEYGWSFIAYWSVFAISGCILWQPVAQRVLAAQKPELNKAIFKATSLMFLGRAFLPIVWGIGAAIYLGAQAEATAGMPKFLSEILPVGMLGFFLAGMFAASMSTDSSYMLAWSSVIVQDIVGPWRRNGISDKSRIFLARLFVCLIGALMLFFGIWHELKDTAFRYLLDVTTIYYAGGLAVLVAGLYWKRANTPGAYLAFIFGAILPVAYVIEDMTISPQAGESAGFVSNILSPNMRGVLSFALGFVGIGLGSLLPFGRSRAQKRV
ncbi:sodium:solute symporter family protein [candidate division KSB1 bacterium]|nr:MAG: sodium:solute symporter family protein [candidate division KSB1 bacterium]MBC6949098.1 sodium:solute symporter family protein [candidate division KSB1 bacterium]MCE7944473.1 sodium:solute symporter family protein [Chlorobi bacterium CHB1]MDL1874962.1 sodium:solute symporter family protein [Cytophagia bacterium CHB2]